jgi:hypothetical protein
MEGDLWRYLCELGQNRDEYILSATNAYSKVSNWIASFKDSQNIFPLSRIGNVSICQTASFKSNHFTAGNQ